MNETYAGILCAVMMLSLYAALHGCLCAFCYKIPCARVIYPLLLSAGFVPLSILISRLGVASALNGRLWTTLASLLFILNGAMLILLLRWIGRHVSRISIKESCDRLPAALCFASENGRPRLMNLRMDEMSHALTAKRFQMPMPSGRRLRVETSTPLFPCRTAERGASSAHG